MISNELREALTPVVLEHLHPDDRTETNLNTMFSEAYLTYIDGLPLVTLKPHEVGYDVAMQFDPINARYIEITSWEYIKEIGELVTEETQFNIQTDETEVISGVLNHYLRNDLKILSDYALVIKNREKITVNNQEIYVYKCPMQTIYLDSNNYAVTYDRQRVDDGKYYYNFTDIKADAFKSDLFTYIAPYEWKRERSGGGGVIG